MVAPLEKEKSSVEGKTKLLVFVEAKPVEVPETEGAVPGAGQGELAVRGDDDVGHEVRVADEGAAGEPAAGLLAVVPDQEGVVCKRKGNMNMMKIRISN